MFHFICFSFQAARLITLVIMSLNASKSSSYAVMGLDIVNALVGMACTAYIMYMCKVNPRRIAPEKLIPDDYCLLGYLFGPMVCYVTFIICGIYFIGMNDHSDKFQSCMSTLGSLNYLLTLVFQTFVL